MTPKELLDWVLAEATAPHGPTLLKPGEIYADMAQRLLQLVLDSEPVLSQTPSFLAEVKPDKGYIISFDGSLTNEMADTIRQRLKVTFPDSKFAVASRLKAVIADEHATCPTCGSTGEPLSINGMLCENPWHADIRRTCNCGMAVNTQREARGPHHHTTCPKWARRADW